jgi:WD40 repeat protein
VLRRHNSELRKALNLAEQNELSTRRLWHDSQMRLAQQVWTSGQVQLAQEILERLRPDLPDRDLRGFEWHYLYRVCHRDDSVLTGHESLSMIITPDGRTLISGDRYGSIVFCDLRRRLETIRIQAHARDAVGLMVSPDGRVLASWSTTAGLPGEVKLWDAHSARHLATVPGMRGYAEALAFAPDSHRLMILEHHWNPEGTENNVVFWNLDSVSGRITLGRPSIAADQMACSANGRVLAIGMARGTAVTLLDAASCEQTQTLSKRLPGIGAIDFSSDGNLVAAHSPGVTIWDTRSGRELGSLPVLSWIDHAFSPDGHALAGITSARDRIELITDVATNPRLLLLEATSGINLHMAFSPDGKMLAGGGSGRPATLWSTSSGRKLAEFPGETGVVGPLVFAPGGESLVFGGEDGRIHSWHFVKKPELITELAAHSAEVWGLAYIPDGASLISSADDGLIKIWDAHNGELRRTLHGHGSLVASVTISRDGSLLASAGFDRTVRLWDLASGRPRAVFRGHTERVRAVAFSPDGRHLASAGSDMTVRIWEIDHGEPIAVYRGHTDPVRALAFDPTGALVVSASDDRTIRGIDGKSGVEKFSLPCANHNSAVVFSPDGSLLASADDRGTLTIWEVATWTRRHSAKGSDTGIWGLSFSPNGKTLAAACGDAKVRLWDPIAGQVTLVLDGHTKRVNAVAFAPDGATLASASHDGAVRFWRTR